MKIKAGQTCASCVIYADTKEYAWIVSKFEKKQASGNYIVRDDYCDTAEYERYTVPPNRVIPFPMQNEKYEPGENIIALWYDETSNVWSTMFYPATVIEVLQGHRVIIGYQGSPNAPNVEIDDSKISKYPEGFDLIGEKDNQKKEEAEKNEEPKEEKKEQKVEENKKENEKKPEEKETKAAVAAQPAVIHVNSKAEEKQDLSKVKAIPQELARVRFMNDQKTTPKESSDFKPLEDADFNDLAGERPKIVRMTTVKGTPLLDFLEDEKLFPKAAPHITGSGLLRRKGIEESKVPSALKNGPVQCGRLGKILFDWRTQE